MQDLSGLAALSLGGAGASMSAGNTTGSPAGPRLSMTAPGSPSVVPPSPTRDIAVDIGGPSEDFARIKRADGSEGVRPSNDAGGWSMAFQPDRIWQQQ